MNRITSLVAVLVASSIWSSLVCAEPNPILKIGYLSGRSPSADVTLIAAFREGLASTGFIEGENVLIEYRWAYGRHQALSVLADELKNRSISLLFSLAGLSAARAAKRATTTIPIVFVSGGDPVKDGLISSMSHPGGNMTGYVNLNSQLEAKQISLLLDLVPSASTIGVLLDPQSVSTRGQLARLQKLQGNFKSRIIPVLAKDIAQIEKAFATFKAVKADALLVGAGSFFASNRQKLIDLSNKLRLVTLYSQREYTAAGGLASYAFDSKVAYRWAGVYVGRILKGAKPSDLPVMQPRELQFVVNLKIAKRLGINISNYVLAQAEEIIE